MEENKLTLFFSRHWSTLLLAVCVAASGIFFFDRTFSSKRSKAKKDYIVVGQIFDRFRAGEPLSAESLATAEEILKRHPELHPKYDALLAHCFLQQENVAQGLAYAKAALKRLPEGQIPYYRHFARTSFLIADENYAVAYAESDKLEAALASQDEFQTLRAFNLLRLTFLSKILGNPDKQHEAWGTLQALPAYGKIAPLFQQGVLSLSDYLG